MLTPLYGFCSQCVQTHSSGRTLNYHYSFREGPPSLGMCIHCALAIDLDFNRFSAKKTQSHLIAAKPATKREKTLSWNSIKMLQSASTRCRELELPSTVKHTTREQDEGNGKRAILNNAGKPMC